MSGWLIVPPRWVTRHQLNEWFPTLVRYVGVALTVVLVVAQILGQNDYPSAYIAAAGMILYKSVAGNGGSGNGHADNWSGLP